MEITLEKDQLSEHVSSDVEESRVDQVKRRMLLWDNPVEFVNNMYSCHPGPGEDSVDYFEEVFGE
jgi:hypothetical protein